MLIILFLLLKMLKINALACSNKIKSTNIVLFFEMAKNIFV